MDDAEKARVNAQAEDAARAVGAIPQEGEPEGVPYTVQVSEGNGRWRDVVTVYLPPKSKRKTAISRAEEELRDLSKGKDGPLMVRVLDGDSADAVPVSWEEREPAMVVG